jgi:hypothetical protein
VRLLALIGLLGALPAEAAAPQAHLLYVRERGAEDCPDDVAMRATVAAHLGREPFSEHAGTTVSVTLSGTINGLRAKIELVDAVGEVTGARELQSRRRDCVDLAPAVALAISLAVDPLSGAPEPDAAPSPSPSPSPSPIVSASANASASVKAAVPPLPKYRFRLGAGTLAALGAAPGVGFGFTVTGGLRGPHFSANLEGRADLPSTGQRAAGGQVAAAQYNGSVIPCFHQGVFAGCGIVQLGAQVSSATGFPITYDATSFTAALGVRAAAELPLSRHLELQASADLLAPLTRTVLEADGRKLYETAPVNGAFHLAILGYFP